MKTDNGPKMLAFGFFAGILLATALFAFGAIPKEIELGPVKWVIPGHVATIKATEPEPTIWQLNPALPPSRGYISQLSMEESREYPSGDWRQVSNISVAQDQLALIFGTGARVQDLAEIGEKTGCFLIATHGPITFSAELKSAKMEIYKVDQDATSREWAAQKADDLRENYPSTCGKGLDILIGK
jgi:hypothetical protein